VLTLAAGGTLVVADQPDLPGAIVRHRATASVITVPRLNRLVRDQRERPADLGGLKVLMVSGSPLEADQLRQALQVLGPVVFQGYGQTETGLIAMTTPAEVLAAPAGFSAVGRPPEGIDVQLRDPDGRPLPPGAQGEVYVRTPSQAVAYWQDPDETADVFVDGWVRTRDLGRLDADGYLHLLGRVRDIIIVNAEIVYAGPIERTLASHPDVVEAHVVGDLDDDTGEAVHAFVVPAPGRIPDPEVLRALVEQRFGAVAVPRTVTFTEQIPTAPSGKPDKRALIHRLGPAIRGVAGD
jgi:acyl-coenzyme A synthetase/AMP-(fatty) acid ligase